MITVKMEHGEALYLIGILKLDALEMAADPDENSMYDGAVATNERIIEALSKALEQLAVSQ